MVIDFTDISTWEFLTAAFIYQCVISELIKYLVVKVAVKVDSLVDSPLD